MTLAPALARALAAGRPRFNAEVAAARRARTGFDLDALAAALRDRVAPLATAVEAVAPDRTAAVVDAAFAQTVALVQQSLSGERRTLVDSVYTIVAVPLAAIVAEQPDATLALLTNAVLTLGATPGARADEWMARMAALAPLVTADTLAATGQVVAWRAGMAHYRDAALALADDLPEPLALAALGAHGAWPEVRAAALADRWWRPNGDPAAVVRIGGFVGFGGPFETPPRVRATADGFAVRAGENTRLIVADAFGATLHAAAPHEFDDAVPADPAAALPSTLPGGADESALWGGGVALTSPWSHYVEIRAWHP